MFNEFRYSVGVMPIVRCFLDYSQHKFTHFISHITVKNGLISLLF